jgi:site-specific DNA recombinase
MKQSCCAYLRKSREDEERERMGKGETLARHEKIIRRLAEENGDSIEEWYREIVSGETIEGREEMKRLLRDLANGKWSRVYVVEASRLGRGGGGDQEKIVNAFRYTGTELVTQDKEYMPDDMKDMRLLRRELQSSEEELESISTRLKRGKEEAAREGIWQSSGRTPFGWRGVRINGLWTLEPDERHADMLRMYDMAESGMPVSRISKVLNAEGVETARGGYHWTPAAVRAVVLNPANAGFVVYGKHSTKKVFDPETFAVKKVRYSNDNPIVVKGLHFGNGGISPERFERVKSILEASPRLKWGSKLRNPLAGILVCGKCGYTMACHKMTTGKSQAYFYQHKRKEGMTRECDGCRGVRAKKLLDALADALESMAEDMEVNVGGGSFVDEQRIKALEKALDKASESRSRAMRAYEAGVYSLEEMKASKEDAERRMEEAEREIEALKSVRVTPDTIVSLRECVRLLKDESVPAQDKNDFLKRVIRRIDYWNDTEPYVHDNRFQLDVFLR